MQSTADGNDETQRLLNEDNHSNLINYSGITTNETRVTSKKLPQYLAAISATGGSLAAGTVFGWTSPAEDRLVDRQNDADFISEYGFHITTEQWSWIGSLVTLGAAMMCLLIGTITNIIGRKSTMLLLIIPFSIGWSFCIWPQNVIMLFIGRFLLGIAGGSFFVVAPIYIGEIAEKTIRGKLASFMQLMVTIGILFVYCIGYDLKVYVFSIICGVLPIVFGLTFIFMPETPLYLISKNRHEDAVRSLQWLRGGQAYDCTDEITELQLQYTFQNTNRTSLWTALKTRATLKALLISFGLMFFLQFSAINIVIFYTGSIFNATNEDISASLSIIIVGIMQCIATFVAAMIIDSLGRRILLITSIFIMAICKILLGVYFYLYTRDTAEAAHIGWLPLMSLCLYIIAFSIGFGPIPWVIVGEIFDPAVKGIATSVVSAFTWILAFVVTKSYVNIRESIGLGPSFWFFAGFSLLGTIFVILIVPETKGKSLNEIQTMLARNDRGNDAGELSPN